MTTKQYLKQFSKEQLIEEILKHSKTHDAIARQYYVLQQPAKDTLIIKYKLKIDKAFAENKTNCFQKAFYLAHDFRRDPHPTIEKAEMLLYYSEAAIGYFLKHRDSIKTSETKTDFYAIVWFAIHQVYYDMLSADDGNTELKKRFLNIIKQVKKFEWKNYNEFKKLAEQAQKPVEKNAGKRMIK